MASIERYSEQVVLEQYHAATRNMVTEGQTPGTLLTAAANLLVNEQIAEWGELGGTVLDRSIQFIGTCPDGDNEDVNVLQSALAHDLFDPVRGAPLSRDVGEFMLTHFPLRGLKTQHEPREVRYLHKPFNPNGFHFGKVKDEIVATVRFGGSEISILPNKFPIAPYHLLLVPDIDEGNPQFLTERYHRLFYEFAQASPPGTIVGFNATGGNSSVNHLHGHALLRHGPVPAMRMADGEFPARKVHFGSDKESWAYINSLHQQGTQSYNNVYSHQGVTVLPRAFQGSHRVSYWTTGYGFYPMAGAAVSLDRDAYHTLSLDEIVNELILESYGAMEASDQRIQRV